MNLLSRLNIPKQLTKTQNNNTKSKALRMIDMYPLYWLSSKGGTYQMPKGFSNFKLHRILIDFKLSDKPLIDSLASSKMPFASLGGFIFS